MAARGLGGSETAARILALLSSMPGQELHTNEIIRRTGSLPNAVQRALTRSEAQGLIQSRRLGNLRLWRMDPNNPLYPSIREMFARTRGIPAYLRDVLAKDPNVSLAFLFGSYVTARDDPTSDIDLFVVGSPDWVALSQALRAAGREVGRAVNPVIWSEDDLRRPAPSQRSFLDSVMVRPITWLVGDRKELERIRARVVPAMDRRRPIRRTLSSRGKGPPPQSKGPSKRRKDDAHPGRSRLRRHPR